MADLPDDSVTRLEIDRLQADYLGRLRAVLRRAPPEIREDALSEVQSHIEDEWRALGGGLAALHTVLQRLGPPEEYGRDLALQLILLHGGRRRLAARLALAIIFWASTSLIGAVVVTGAMLILAFALGMLATALARALGIPMMLVDATKYQVFAYHGEGLHFPPETWSPALIGLVGLIPAVIIFAGLYRFLRLWMRSRLAQRGLVLATTGRSPMPPPGWERRALLAILAFAVLGMGGCLLFSILSELVPIGYPGTVRLPDDFFRTPITALAFVSGLVFLVSPVLGLWWATTRTTSNALMKSNTIHHE